MKIDCNQISCDTKCKEPLTSDCIILSGACQDLCYVNFCEGIPTLKDFIASLCLDFQKIKYDLECMRSVCEPDACSILISPITIIT